jgi:hypothetical protein
MGKKKQLVATITMGDDKSLHLSAKDMNEMIEKIIEWQSWTPGNETYYGKKGKLKQEKESGWYYFPKDN